MRLLASLLLVLAAARPGAEEQPPEPGITVRQLDGARLVEAVLAGRAVDVAASAAGVAVLVAPTADGPRTLLRFDPDDGELVELARDLPAAIDAVALLVVDGRPRIVLGEPGVLYSLALDAPAEPRRLHAAPSLDLALARRHGLVLPGSSLLPQPRVGGLEIFRYAGGALTLAAAVDLPVRARRERAGLRLSTPRPTLLEGAGLPWIAAGPERRGRRLLTTLIDPGGVAAEAWSRLPADERVAQSWYLSLDGRPALAVATLRTDKLGILEKKKLRVFALRTDRTRAGAPPALEIETVTRNWYPLGVQTSDLDGDGRADLVVVQPDGMGAGKLVVEAYRGQGNGGFYRTPRRSVVAARDAGWSFGHDVDGDGVGDLVALDEGRRLLIFRGLADGRKLVEKSPRWSLAAGSADEIDERVVEIGVGDGDEGDEAADPDLGLRMIDLDGDGRHEVLVLSRLHGRSILRHFAPR